ncbi:MAG: TRAP transporter small permease [Betaproteobacteria bacterium]
MNALRRFAERAIDVAAIVVFVAIFGCVIGQVVLRYVFNNPMTWSEELARYLFIWCSFLGWIIASRRHGHLAMSYVAERLPPRAQALLSAVIALATLLFAWILGSRGMKLVTNNWDIENVAVPFTLGMVYLIVPLASVAIAAYAGAGLVDSVRKLRYGT